MQYAAIIEVLTVLAPALLALGSKFIKGNKRFIFAIAAYFILRKMALQAAQQKALSNIQSEGGYQNANALATSYKQAMNPSGYSWMFGFDGTDEDLIYQLAAKTGNYKNVYDAYKKQYNRDLTTDLQSELSTGGYQLFMNILNNG